MNKTLRGHRQECLCYKNGTPAGRQSAKYKLKEKAKTPRGHRQECLCHKKRDAAGSGAIRHAIAPYALRGADWRVCATKGKNGEGKAET